MFCSSLLPGLPRMAAPGVEIRVPGPAGMPPVVLPLASPASPAPTELDSNDDYSPADTAGLGVEETWWDDSGEDDRMNGSPGPLNAEELAAVLAARAPPPTVCFGRLLPADPRSRQGQVVRSPGALPGGDGMLAVAGWMRGAVAPVLGRSGVEVSGRIDWCIAWDTPPFDHCCRIINALSSTYYIGITENPERRFVEHEDEGTCGSDPLMIVLFEADSSRWTVPLEKQLVAKYRHQLRCMNVSGGGERASAGSPHFLYVLYSSSPLLRRGRRR